MGKACFKAERSAGFAGIATALCFFGVFVFRKSITSEFCRPVFPSTENTVCSVSQKSLSHSSVM